MAKLELRYNGVKAGRTLDRNMKKEAVRTNRAMKGTADDAAREILVRGRADIAGAGNFGVRWTSGLRARVTGERDIFRVTVSHSVPYFNIFQKGGVIRGKPLLWIPASFAPDAKGISASEYPGHLVRTRSRRGTPLLIARETGRTKYIGKTSVKIPKKFHIVEICREVSGKLGAMYKLRFSRTL